MPEFTLESLADVVALRAQSADPQSYTAKLAAAGALRCAKKLGEEAVEAALAGAVGDRDALRAEAADVLYHLLVLLHVNGVPYRDVLAELERRTGETGLQEKARRNAPA
jgi:phosphoribosyl-ATP pyrophosphohydrolase